MPKISIIVPIYNVEKYLKECVDSVLTQSFNDFELILVDDGSPDSCPLICDEYEKKDDRVRVIHKKNAGVSAARNSGIEIACGEYIWFVDADDMLLENALKTAASCFDKNADIMCFKNLIVYDNGEISSSEKDIAPNDFSGDASKLDVCEMMKKACTKNLLPFMWRNVYRASFLKENQIKFDESLSYGEDSVFNMQAFLIADKMFFSKEEVYLYRCRSDGVSRGYGKEFDFKIKENLERYCELRDENYEKFCIEKHEEYYQDAGRYVIEVLYLNALIKRVYKSESKNKFSIFKQISKTKMIRQAFERFDLNNIQSKGFDFFMYKAVKHKCYFLGHLICKYVLIK